MPASFHRLAAQQVPHNGTLALTHATVIDTESGTARHDCTVVVDGSRIARVGPTDEVVIPANAEVVDLGHRHVIPGLWDMHVHVFNAEQLPLFLHNGVTGIRHMGGIEAHGQWRDELVAGRLQAPRMVVASPIIDGPQPLRPGSIAVGDEAEARGAVQQSSDQGADFLKVYNLIPREAYFALMDQARRLGIPVSGHVPFGVTVEEASDAGQASVEHLEGVVIAASSDRDQLRERIRAADTSDLAAVSSVFAELMPRAVATYDPDRADSLYQQFITNGTWQAPTLAVLQAAAEAGTTEFPLTEYLQYMEPHLRQIWQTAADASSCAEQRAQQQELFAHQLWIVGQLHCAGVQLLAGTDTFVSGFSLHDELELFVAAGLSPFQALQTATLNPARYLEGTEDFGTITEGKVADIAVLERDPRVDIGNTRSLHSLVLGGRFLDRTHLDNLLTQFENHQAAS